MARTPPVLELAVLLRDECIGLRVNRLQRIIARRYANALRPLEISNAQVELLAVLVLHGGPVKPTAIADELGVEKSTLSRNLALMIEATWVAAADTSASGRAMTVSITPTGMVKLTSARAAWATAQRDIVALLGDRAAKTLDGWLAALSE